MVVYGAGYDLSTFLSFYPEFIYYIDYIVDSDAEKTGKDFFGFDVKPKEFIKNMKNGENVVISSRKFYDDISNTVKNQNETLNCIYIADVAAKILRNHFCNFKSKIYYTNAEHERNTMREYKDWYIVRNDEFFERYTNLVKNLDEESVDTVNLILKRMELLYLSDSKQYDIFTETEKKKILEIREELFGRIIEVKKGIYAYKNYILPRNYFNVGTYSDKYGIEFLKSLPEIKNGNILDLGAFIGDTSLMFSKLTTGTVYAVEAQKKNCEIIKKVIELNSASNIEIIQTGVGEKEGKTTFYYNSISNWGTMRPLNDREYTSQEEISITSVDKLVEKHNLKISLIKADIEGMESAMIRGAVNTLRKQKPALLLKLHHTPYDFFGIKPFIEALNLGYKFKIHKQTDGNIITGTLLIAEV